MGKGLTWPSFKELCTKIKWKFPTSWWMGLKHWVLPTATKTAKCNSKTVCVFSVCSWMQLVKRLNYKRLKDFSRTRCRPGILSFTRASFHRKTNLILTTWRKTDETKVWNGTPKKKKRFEEQGLVYGLQKERDFYCETGVKVLQGSCQQFSERFQERCGFNPLREDVTIATACNREFKLNHVQANTIAVEPVNGWGGYNVNQSHWMVSISRKERGCWQVKALTQRWWTKSAVTYRLEICRRIQSRNKTCLWIFGRFYHGCPDCLKTNRNTKRPILSNRSFHEVYLDTQAKCQQLKQHYNLGQRLGMPVA